MSIEILESPGSVKDFAERNGLDPTEALKDYTIALGGFRRQVLKESSVITIDSDGQQPKTEEED